MVARHEVLADFPRHILQPDIGHPRLARAPLLQPSRALLRIFLVGQQLLVATDRFTRLPVVLELTLLEENPTIAHSLERSARVRDERDCHASPLELEDALDAFPLEGLVPDGEHLVEEQDFCIDVDGDREPEAHVHARGVRSNWQVDEALELAELDDRVEPAVDLLFAQAVDRCAQVDVVAAGEVRVEAGAELEQCTDPAGNGETATRGPEDTASSLRSVVFPEPFRPMKPTDSPGSTWNETSRSAQTSTGRKWRRRTIASFSVTCRCG